jgi:hypothetical protein
VACAEIPIISQPQPPVGNAKLCGNASPKTAQIVRSTLESLYNNTTYADAANRLQTSVISTYAYSDHTQFGLSGGWLVPLIPTGGPPMNCVLSDYKSLEALDVGLTDTSCNRALQPYSAIFETDHPHGSNTNPHIANTTAHEFGHQLDLIYGVEQFGSGDFSSSSQFIAALDQDLYSMDQLPPCTFDAKGPDGIYKSSGTSTPASTGGLPGLFSYLKDYQGNYICSTDNIGGDGRNLAGSYSGLNENIISQAFPGLLYQQIHELFAEEVAFTLDFPDFYDNSNNLVNGSDGILGASGLGSFACTQFYISTLAHYGRLPTSTELSYVGYTVPDPGNPSTPGYTFTPCDGSAGYHINWEFGS